MTIYLHFVRHAQGYHNLSIANQELSDPRLTALGESQCAELCRTFPHHAAITHLVASPMRRTLQTCLLSFAPAAAAGRIVTALPEIQEVSTLPCDVGSDPAVVKEEADFKGRVDFSRVGAGWNDKSPSTAWAPDVKKLEARAAAARRFLRQLGRESSKGGKEDVHMAVVSHGGLLHFLNQDWSGMEEGQWTGWANAECRTYEFVDPEADDEDANVHETEVSWRARRGSTTRLTDTEQRELRAAIQGFMQGEFDGIVARQEAARAARAAAL